MATKSGNYSPGLSQKLLFCFAIAKVARYRYHPTGYDKFQILSHHTVPNQTQNTVLGLRSCARALVKNLILFQDPRRLFRIHRKQQTNIKATWSLKVNQVVVDIVVIHFHPWIPKEVLLSAAIVRRLLVQPIWSLEKWKEVTRAFSWRQCRNKNDLTWLLCIKKFSWVSYCVFIGCSSFN